MDKPGWAFDIAAAFPNLKALVIMSSSGDPSKWIKPSSVSHTLRHLTVYCCDPKAMRAIV